jgi:hypothetical protein
MGKPTLCGASGAGQMVKACNQIQVALNFIGMAEALVLGAKAGVDPEIIIKVLSAGYAQTRVMDVRGPRILKGRLRPRLSQPFPLQRSEHHPRDGQGLRRVPAGLGAGPRAVHRHDRQRLGRPGSLGGRQGHRAPQQLQAAGQRVGRLRQLGPLGPSPKGPFSA